uniref:Dynein regulatory complex subunit 3 n=1 Tax=Cyprinodon variegatus TaxID=28743 RepID=A0A3Q2DQ24_CYPVA
MENYDDLTLKEMVELTEDDRSFRERRVLINNKIPENLCSDIIELDLEGREIRNMDFLIHFTSLVKLDLMRKNIEKISGLGLLTHLTWLDLSFNRIKKIEGLESLRKLELLALSNNEISLLENMDTLENLTHFYISHNLIGHLDNVLYLRRFKRLDSISITGNPFTEKEDEKMYVAAFLPSVTRLDHLTITQRMREEAILKYQNDQTFRALESEAKQTQRSDQNQESQGTSVDNTVTRGTLVLQTDQSQLMELFSRIVFEDLAKQNQIKKELNTFLSHWAETEAFFQQRTLQIFTEFEEQHMQRMVEIQNLEDREQQKIKIENCNDEILQLRERLLTLEFELIGKKNENIKQFDSWISDNLSTGNNSDSHDDHLETINGTENEMVSPVNDLKAAIKQIQEEEEKWTCMRTSNMNRYVDQWIKELEGLHLK